MRTFVFGIICYSLVTIAASADIVLQGLTNTPLGGATIDYITNLGSGGQDGLALYITNLGSGGQDGVGITLPPNLTGLSVTWAALDVSNALPVGASIKEQAMGSGSTGSSPLGSVTVTKMGTGNYSISADYSAIGASTYTAQAYLQNVLVAQASGLSGSSLARANLPPGGDDVGDIITPLSQEWPGGNAALLIGTTLVKNCDRLVITPENVTPPSGATALQITTAGISSLTISNENESVIYQGLSNTSLGGAALSEPCCVSNLGSGGQDGLALYITNIGGGGQDGLTFALPANLSALNVVWEPLEASNTLPIGASIQEQVIGTGNGITNGRLGTLYMRKSGVDSYTLTADYSPAGASTYTVQAYRQGNLVMQATHLSGSSLATGSQFPTAGGCGNAGALGMSFQSATVQTVFLGGAAVTCDRLYVLPENVSASVSGFQIAASQVPTLTVIGENESLPFEGLTATSLASATVGLACCVSNLGSGGQDGLSLYITNLGSGGQDGLTFAVPANLTVLEAFWQDLDDSDTLPAGAYLQEQVIGTASGITNGVLGTLTLTKNATADYTLQPDFTPLGTGTTCVGQAYSNGVLVAEATLPSPRPALAHPRGFAVSCGFAGGGSTNLQWFMSWGTNPISFAFPGGPTVTCNYLLFAPQNTAISGTPTALQVVGYEIPAVNFTDTEVSPFLTVIGQNGSNLLLQWLGSGVLQQSTNLNTWTNITNATSPYTLPASSGRQNFYRVSHNPLNRPAYLN